MNNSNTIVFDRACQFLFDLLLQFTIREFDKSKNKIVHTFNFLIYSQFLSKVPSVELWKSMLPGTTRIGAIQSVVFLLEIVTDVFRHMFFEGMSMLQRQLRKLPPGSNGMTSNITANNHTTQDADDGSTISKEEEDSEVQRFFGWAIKELIDVTTEHACKHHVSEDEYSWKHDKELLLVKSFRVLHHEVITDIDYMANYYPPFYSAYNMGGLCLVSKLYFPLAKNVLQIIRTDSTYTKMKHGDDTAVLALYDGLTGNKDLFAQFLNCVHVGGYGEYVDENSKQKMWNYLITKTCHARIGVVTREFAENTTGRYSSVSITESLRSDLKVKSRGKSVARADKETK